MNQENTKKLEILRSIMEREGLSAYLVPRTDEYQGEFLAPYAERLKWLTGFSGSAGIGLILQDKAAVLTDGRYILQIRNEIDPDLYEFGDITKISAGAWLNAHMRSGDIGYDTNLFTQTQIDTIRKDFVDKEISFKRVKNLIDEIWHDQPKKPSNSINVFPDSIAGYTSVQKRQIIASQLQAKSLDGFLVTALDSIAWLLNMRGRDVAYTPLFFSVLLMRADGSVILFIDPGLFTPDLYQHAGQGVDICTPEEIFEIFRGLRDQKIGLDFKTCPLTHKIMLESNGVHVENHKDPIADARAIKSFAEQAAIRAAHVRDGVAISKLLYWIEKNAGLKPMTELDVVNKIENFRAQAPEYRGSSFPAIVGFGPNGAIIHYRPALATNLEIQKDNLLLIDSGGQYVDGTTDITRTIAIGKISPEMKKHFTLVLKGHINLASTRFKPGTTGKTLDEIARAPLKAAGLDYAHGTGHGVGCYLGVHEDAANLSPRGERAPQAGMLLSNEPGYYLEGSHGIRTENLMFVQEDEASNELYFETVTLAPIDKNAIDETLLSAEDKDWLNTYHARVCEALSGLLPNDVAVWLKEKTARL